MARRPACHPSGCSGTAACCPYRRPRSYNAQPMSLEGKVVVVTGGARELGLTAAEALLRAGARVSIWDVDAEALERAEAELLAQGFEPDLHRVDITDLDGLSAA